MSRPRTWIAFAPVVVAVTIGLQFKTALDVAAVQNAVQRDWEIEFGEDPDKPPLLPEFLDAAAWEYFFNRYPDPEGLDAPSKSRNRSEVFYARFRALFRGSIREIHVYECEAFCGDLGAALARFPKLRRVTVFDDSVPESDWTFFCKSLRKLPRLKEIGLGGSGVTDEAIAPLSGHPNVQSIVIEYGRLTERAVTTFASMPQLTSLSIVGDPDGVRLSEEEKAAMKTALPGVTIDFP